MVIRDGVGEVFGSGRVAIYDNKKHGSNWYYWLKAGEKFDFKKRSTVVVATMHKPAR